MFPLPFFIHTHTHSRQCVFSSPGCADLPFCGLLHTHRSTSGLVTRFSGDSVESQISPSTSTGTGTGSPRSGRPLFVVNRYSAGFYFFLRDFAGFRESFTLVSEAVRWLTLVMHSYDVLIMWV